MKFLIDRCAGHLLAEWLRSEGHDVVEGLLTRFGQEIEDGAIVTVRGGRERISKSKE